MNGAHPAGKEITDESSACPGRCDSGRKKAIELLKKAIAIDNNYYFAITELGYSYYKLEQYSEALSRFSTVMAASPKNELSRYYAGFCYSLENDQANLKKMMDELKAINTANALKYAETLAKYVK
jgi:tetratricopeptide (TPR) repeat protein